MDVRSVTLDDEYARIGRAPDVLKVDVEEAEHLVFLGAEQMLREFKPKVVFECLTPERAIAVTEVLAPIGYSFQPISQRGGKLRLGDRQPLSWKPRNWLAEVVA